MASVYNKLMQKTCNRFCFRWYCYFFR